MLTEYFLQRFSSQLIGTRLITVSFRTLGKDFRLAAKSKKLQLFGMPTQHEPSSVPAQPRHLPLPKALFLSPTSSSEADDEDSFSSPSNQCGMDPDYDHNTHSGPPEYFGDDTRLTSRKELSGWYSYGWAAEVFVVCGMGSFIPITLEQLARDQGVLLSDKSTPCRAGFNKPGQHAFGNMSLPMESATPTAHSVNGQCVVHLFGAEINTASFAMYTFSISVLVQSLLIISISAAADHGNYRKKLLLFFAFIGSTATMLFLAVIPKTYVLGALLAIFSNTSFGASFVLLNSFLPLLVRHHPSVQKTSQDHRSLYRETQDTTPDNSDLDDDVADLSHSSEALLATSQAGEIRTTVPSKVPKQVSPELSLSTQISSYGIGIGYIAALLVQTLAILIILFIKSVSDSDTLALRVVLFFVGLWWLLFTIPAALWLRPRPGPPLSFTSGGRQVRGWRSYIAYAWRSLGKTVFKARRLKDVSLFLVAWFLLSDSIATISGTAVLFAKTQLQMEPPAIALINVIATLSGVVGAFSWSKISLLFNARPSQTIVACICLFEIIPIYGLLGFVPAIQKLGNFGLQQPWEMYPLGAVYGFVLGGLSSYCRAVFGELIPPGSEAAFYALYAITDKGSSVFGPAIVGAITDKYGEIRPAFVFLAVLIFLPLPLMMLVDVDRGRRDGTAIANELRGNRSNITSYANTDGTINLIDEEARVPED